MHMTNLTAILNRLQHLTSHTKMKLLSNRKIKMSLKLNGHYERQQKIITLTFKQTNISISMLEVLSPEIESLEKHDTHNLKDLIKHNIM